MAQYVRQDNYAEYLMHKDAPAVQPKNLHQKIQFEQEKKWKEGVMTDPDALDAGWKTFDEWSTLFEPKKEPKEEKVKDNKKKEDAEPKKEDPIKAAIMKKVQDGLVQQIVTTITEITCRALGPVQVALRASPTPLAHELGAVVDACTAIVLSYRFGFNKKKRFPFLRRLASDKMVDLLMLMFDQNAETAQQAVETAQQAVDAAVETTSNLQDAAVATTSNLQDALPDLMQQIQVSFRTFADTKMDDIMATSGEAALNSMAANAQRALAQAGAVTG